MTDFLLPWELYVGMDVYFGTKCFVINPPHVLLHCVSLVLTELLATLPFAALSFLWHYNNICSVSVSFQKIYRNTNKMNSEYRKKALSFSVCMPDVEHKRAISHYFKPSFNNTYVYWQQTAKRKSELSKNWTSSTV